MTTLEFSFPLIRTPTVPAYSLWRMFHLNLPMLTSGSNSCVSSGLLHKTAHTYALTPEIKPMFEQNSNVYRVAKGIRCAKKAMIWQTTRLLV